MNKDLMFPAMYGAGNPINLRKLGKHRKRAVFALSYGASINTVVKLTGLSRRVVRVLRKTLLGSRKTKVISSHQIVHGGRKVGKSNFFSLLEKQKERGIEIKPNKGGSC